MQYCYTVLLYDFNKRKTFLQETTIEYSTCILDLQCTCIVSSQHGTKKCEHSRTTFLPHLNTVISNQFLVNTLFPISSDQQQPIPPTTHLSTLSLDSPMMLSNAYGFRGIVTYHLESNPSITGGQFVRNLRTCNLTPLSPESDL